MEKKKKEIILWGAWCLIWAILGSMKIENTNTALLMIVFGVAACTVAGE